MVTVCSKSGLLITSTAADSTHGKEIEYDTRQEAESRIKVLKSSLPDQDFYIHETNVMGRPTIGITRKVSLTLSKEDWIRFDDQAAENRSKYLRNLLIDSFEGLIDKEQIAKKLFNYMELFITKHKKRSRKMLYSLMTCYANQSTLTVQSILYRTAIYMKFNISQ